MKNKKMAAALAAVTNYIKSEEESIATQLYGPAQPAEPVVQAAPAVDPGPTTPISRWKSGGREALMQMRQTMQMRLMGR